MEEYVITHLAQIDGEQSIAARQAEARRRNLARKRAQAQATKALVARAGSPPPVPGRKHEPVQTEVYLEEVSNVALSSTIRRTPLSSVLQQHVIEQCTLYLAAIRQTRRNRCRDTDGLLLG